MTDLMIVYGVFTLIGIAGYARWARRMDAAEQYRQRSEALRRVTGDQS